MTFFGLTVLGFLAGMVVAYLTSSHLIYAAFLEGKRLAFKKAVRIAEDRVEPAIALAPAGSLREGLLRGQMANQIAFELRIELAKVS